ncbi:PaaX family transcriptional regulator C-terminal domain-containing protein [Georgenia sp. Z1491]|uniref:PaaX family transcriptional regulator n=1 Tax=Georgenia sp. Z1491 TaxID=3416707 RepID=UPI003CEF7D49
MSVRSAILDVVGYYVRFSGGSIGLTPLSELLGALGIQGDAVRATMTRLRAEGWFTSAKEGRQVTYSMTPHLYAIVDEGRERIFSRRSGPWDGEWHMVLFVVPESKRAVRESLRKRLSFQGFGSPAPSTWMSTTDRRAEVDAMAIDLGIDSSDDVRLIQMMSRTDSVALDRQIARQCWDLERLNDGYREWLREWRPRVATQRAHAPDGPAALAELVDLVSTFRKFPFDDPDLPGELLPATWHGTAAFAVFHEGLRALVGAADRYVTDVTGQVAERPATMWGTASETA